MLGAKGDAEEGLRAVGNKDAIEERHDLHVGACRAGRYIHAARGR